MPHITRLDKAVELLRTAPMSAKQLSKAMNIDEYDAQHMLRVLRISKRVDRMPTGILHHGKPTYIHFALKEAVECSC